MGQSGPPVARLAPFFVLIYAQDMLQELVDYASKTEGQGGVVGLGVSSEEIKGLLFHGHVSDGYWMYLQEPPLVQAGYASGAHLLR